jgi:hypothetical protein
MRLNISQKISATWRLSRGEAREFHPVWGKDEARDLIRSGVGALNSACINAILILEAIVILKHLQSDRLSGIKPLELFAGNYMAAVNILSERIGSFFMFQRKLTPDTG